MYEIYSIRYVLAIVLDLYSIRYFIYVLDGTDKWSASELAQLQGILQ